MKLLGPSSLVLSVLLGTGTLACAQADPAVAADAQARAALDTQAEVTLQGRPALAIVGIVNVSDPASKLTTESVQETVELALRRNGIPVAPSCEAGQNCGRLIAAIRATCKDLFPVDRAGAPTGVCAAYVRVEYQELVHPTRPKSPPAADAAGDLWFDDSVGLVTSPFQGESARKRLAEMVERFALYYLRANPKK